eukprot:scaffold13761_cov15-Prasinocladus_malaysianus.AAC.1
MLVANFLQCLHTISLLGAFGVEDKLRLVHYATDTTTDCYPADGCKPPAKCEWASLHEAINLVASGSGAEPPLMTSADHKLKRHFAICSHVEDG